jgi:hypothetical protein
LLAVEAEKDPWRLPCMPRHFPSFFFLPPCSLLLFSSVLAHSSQSSLPSPAIPHLPLLLREAEKIPDAALFLLARRIEPECPKSPQIPRRT